MILNDNSDNSLYSIFTTSLFMYNNSAETESAYPYSNDYSLSTCSQYVDYNDESTLITTLKPENVECWTPENVVNYFINETYNMEVREIANCTKNGNYNNGSQYVDYNDESTLITNLKPENVECWTPANVVNLINETYDMEVREIANGTKNENYYNDSQYDDYNDELNLIRDEPFLTTLKSENVECWTPENVVNWINETYDIEGLDYMSVKTHYFNECTGREFIKMPEYKFIEADRIHGVWFYRKVRELANGTINKNYYNEAKEVLNNFGRSNKHFDLYLNCNSTSNGFTGSSSVSECENEPVVKIIKKQRGRPRNLHKIIKNPEKKKLGKVWEFIRDLLLNRETCPHLIRWENHDQGVFRFVSGDKVAKLWGSKRGNKEMNYEKFSRAMRYYYRSGILEPVIGKRLVYKFGPTASGWRTTNPNFSK